MGGDVVPSKGSPERTGGDVELPGGDVVLSKGFPDQAGGDVDLSVGDVFFSKGGPDLTGGDVDLAAGDVDLAVGDLRRRGRPPAAAATSGDLDLVGGFAAICGILLPLGARASSRFCNVC